MNGILQDLAYVVRRLRAQPGFTVVSIPVFALGIGVNTAIFSIINAALFRSLPVKDPGELVSIYGVHGKGSRPSSVSYSDYLDLREQKGAFSDVLAFTVHPAPLSAGGRTEVGICELVSDNYFDVLGVRPGFGRTFPTSAGKAGDAQPVVVVSNSFWKHRLNSDPSVLGTNIKINGAGFMIIGVAPPAFKGLWFPEVASAQVWIPLGMAGSIPGVRLDLADRSASQVMVIGRLARGATLEQARAAANLRARQLALSYPATNRDHTFRLIPTANIRILADPSSDAVPRLISVALIVISGVVLVIAGTNIAGLLTARGVTRRKEIAIRLAIGAGRWRVVRQLLAETLLLAALGGILGLILAKILLRFALASVPARIEFFEMTLDVPIDLHVLWFTFLVCLGTGLLVGLLPALHTTRTDLTSFLGSEGLVSARRRPRGLRHWILVPQICCSLVLLLIAGLFVAKVLGDQWVDPGFKTEHAATAAVDLTWNNYTEEAGRDFYRRLLAGAQAMPGVTSASLVNALPLSGGPNGPPLDWIRRGELSASEAGAYRTVHCGRISPGYFQSMSIPLMRGRDFNEADGSSSVPVAIVSEAAARSLWPGEDPLGKRLAFHESEPRSFEVVGVVKDIRAAPLSRTQFPYVYVLFGQRYSSRMVLVVRCTGNPSAFADRMKDLVYQIDENVAAVETKTLAENVGFIPYLLRIAAAFLAVCGVFGLLLATVGLYGVVSYSVAQRTREIGIRTALGAQRMDVIKMVISEGFKVTLIATILGLLAGMAAKRYIQTFSLGRVTLDPFVFVTVPVILGAVVLLACYIPARRAARTDPMSALREL